MRSHLLCYHSNKEKSIICHAGYEINEKTGKIKWTEKFRIPDSEWKNRLMIDARGILSCSKVGDEVSCYIHAPRGLLPKMCYRDKQGKEYCGYDMIREKTNEFLVASMHLADFEKIRPDLVQWMIDEGVVFMYDGKTERSGWANCKTDYYKVVALSPKSSHPVETIAHEIAHCKEDIIRKRKGLPPMYAKWERKGKRLIPIGGEERAVHFQERIRKLK